MQANKTNLDAQVIQDARTQAIAHFIEQAGWGGAERRPLAGDASNRCYDRLFDGNSTAVLMDAPPSKENVLPFIRRANWICERGHNAPAILAKDIAQGLLLLEDLGDDLFTRHLQKTPSHELQIYKAAIEVLVDWYKEGVPDIEGIEKHTPEKMLSESVLFCDWFLPQVVGQEKAKDLRHEFIDIWDALFNAIAPLYHGFVHWDFHADNLLWLAKDNGKKRVGIIDFQDGMIGDPAFDMVSLLEDARRDVAQDTVAAMLDYFIAQTGVDKESFMQRYALLGAQRNCKIIGIFVRLALRDGKKHYLDFQPRVWKHLQRDIAHPDLAPLKTFIDAHVADDYRGITPLSNVVEEE